MDARAWTGDDERDLDHVDTCAECGRDLYPEERDLCRRCAETRAEAAQHEDDAA